MLDLGNAGTGARLLMGLLAGHAFTSFLTGDASLRSRPMRRVIEPLGRMGASFLARSGGRLPLALTGRHRPAADRLREPGGLGPGEVGRAAGRAARADGDTTVIEPLASRDHTERMLAAMGAEVAVEAGAGRRPAGDHPGPARAAAAELRRAGRSLLGRLPDRGRGPGRRARRSGSRASASTRCAPASTPRWREMGAAFAIEDERTAGGEPVGDLVIRGRRSCAGVEVPAERAPDHDRRVPDPGRGGRVRRAGTTVMRGLAELRVKESDRLATMADGLAACGVQVEVEGDDLIVHGGGRPAGGALIDAQLDHRIAMSFLVLGGLAGAAGDGRRVPRRSRPASRASPR